MCICPFCKNKIEKQQIDFIFENFENERWNFVETLGQEGALLKPRVDERYKRFCDIKEWSDQNAVRVFLNRVEIDDLILILRNRCGIETKGGIYKDNGNINESFDFDNDNYTIQIQLMNRKDGDPRLSISDGIMENKAKMLCPKCHNVLPPQFFEYEQINIGLIGRKEAGKTTTLISMLSHNLCALNGDRNILEFEEINMGTYNSEYNKLRQMVKNLDEINVVPESTPAKFIPPVMLKVTWKNEKQNHTAMVCIFDAAGEIMENTSIESHNKEILRNLLEADGCIYIIDPTHTKFGTPIQAMRDDEREKLYEKAKILSLEEQQARQNRYNQHKKTVYDILLEQLNEVDTSSKIRNFYQELRANCDQENLPKVALVLAKVDKIMNRVDPEYECIFDQVDGNQFLTEPTPHKDFRSEYIRKLFDHYVINSNQFGSIPMDLYVASALGCDAERKEREGNEVVYALKGTYAPIRIGESFVRMTMQLMEDKFGGNE